MDHMDDEVRITDKKEDIQKMVEIHSDFIDWA